MKRKKTRHVKCNECQRFVQMGELTSNGKCVQCAISDHEVDGELPGGFGYCEECGRIARLQIEPPDLDVFHICDSLCRADGCVTIVCGGRRSLCDRCIAPVMKAYNRELDAMERELADHEDWFLDRNYLL